MIEIYHYICVYQIYGNAGKVVLEPHDHPGCDIVSVIFLDDPTPKGGEFYFKNYNGQTPHVVQYKKGDMIVFSPKMIHGVTPLNLSVFDQIKKKKKKNSINQRRYS